MPFGPGKYDDLCTEVRKQVGIPDSGKGPATSGVLLVVINGNKGDGFSCQASAEALMTLPEVLEDVARQLRRDREAAAKQVLSAVFGPRTKPH